jgi:hypothetical protein
MIRRRRQRLTRRKERRTNTSCEMWYTERREWDKRRIYGGLLGSLEILAGLAFFLVWGSKE